MNWRSKPAWVFLSWFLMIASFAWASFILNDGIQEILTKRIHTDVFMTWIAWVLLTVSIVANINTFSITMKATGSKLFSFLEIGELHLTGQLMRHLPGRFFGVIYQAAKAQHIASSGQWITGNMTVLIMSTWVGITLAFSVMTTHEAYWHLATSALALIFAFSFAFFFISQRMSLQFNNKFIQYIMKILTDTKDVLFSKAGMHGLIWVFVSWLIYGAAWVFLALSVQLTWQDGLILGSLYTLAWAIGYFSLLTPGGLGVRELAFALLTSSYSPELIAYFAVIARIGMIISEASLSLIFLLLLRIKNHDKTN